MVEEEHRFAVFSRFRPAFVDFLQVRGEFGFSEGAGDDIFIRPNDIAPSRQLDTFSAVFWPSQCVVWLLF